MNYLALLCVLLVAADLHVGASGAHADEPMQYRTISLGEKQISFQFCEKPELPPKADVSTFMSKGTRLPLPALSSASLRRISSHPRYAVTSPHLVGRRTFLAPA
jgi:hypothetical protein